MLENLLADKISMRTFPGVVNGRGICAYPHHWQVPAATEKAAYESLLRNPKNLDFDYIGFPWATLIDGLRNDSVVAEELLIALREIVKLTTLTKMRRVTVAQHIHAVRFVDLFKACGITDIFWSHATHEQPIVAGIQLHGFPLFPAQTPERRPKTSSTGRRYLANFIGAYNPNVYLTNVRQAIFNDEKLFDNVLIVKRDAWHFDRVVYEEQVRGQGPDTARIELEEKHAYEYLNAMEESWFTLCPSGSGPNSIRIFESLCIGSIPIILTRSLRLPGPAKLWEESALIEEDSEEGYRRAIARAQATSITQRQEMLRAGAELLPHIMPENYSNIIYSVMGK